MSDETAEWLNTQTLIGFTDKRGNAWHYRAEYQGDESNHYPGEIPAADVHRRLFNWEAVELPLYAQVTDTDGSTRYIPIEDRKAIARPDTWDVFGVPKQGYSPHQFSEWLVESVESLVGDGLGIASAGLLKKGAVAWVQVEVPDTVDTPAGFSFRPFLTAATSLDLSLATVYKRGSQATVCDNTLALALAEQTEQVRIKHSSNSQLRLADAREALLLVEKQADEFTDAVAALVDWRVTTREWLSFLDATVPVDESKPGRSLTLATNRRQALTELYTHDDRCAPWNGTALGVLQATNTYQHHVQRVKGDTPRAQRNALNALTGVTAKADARTLAVLASITPAPASLHLAGV
ncbi:MAG: DUF932 domain-containing protein [Rhodospirillales bacterium]|nr:DUF932 domain-containing protein [Rhodospirillales bacterium]